LIERLRSDAGRRALAFGLVLLVEGILLLLLLSLGTQRYAGEKIDGITVIDVRAEEVAEEAAEPAPEPERRAEEQAEPKQPAEQPLPPRPAEPLPAQPALPKAPPIAPAIIPKPEDRPASPAVPSNPAPPAPAPKRVYGPPDTGGPKAMRDTERVGTAPNGEPLYAAAWYREPRPEQLRAYLSTASGPGWGLIACRTAPDYRVEDCVGLDEYPNGSQIMRAVLAAAWEFKVRPPRLGGRPLVGSWVRIRIDYGMERR
jgi:protein TonB